MATRLNAPFPICGGTVFNVVSPATGTLYTLDGRGSALFNDVDVPYFLTQGYSQAASGTGGGGGTVTQVNTGTGLSGGPILSSGTIALANTPVVPGTYMNTNLTVDAQGRITSAGNGSGGAGGGTVTNIATGTGLSGGPITITGTIALANTAVAPGSYTAGNFTVDAQGRLTAAANGNVGVTSLATTAPITGGTITGTGTIGLANTAVTPGSYISANITVDATGRLTAAANGTGGGGGGGTVTSVGAGTGLTGGPITTSGVLALANTAVTPGGYTNANITVDAQGRLIAAASGTGTGGGLPAGGTVSQAIHRNAAGAGVWVRQLETINVMDFGAIADNTSHPLSSIYGSLAAAQAVYPWVDDLTLEVDHCAIQSAIDYTYNNNLVTVSIPDGSYFTSGPIFLDPPLSLRNQGAYPRYASGTTYALNDIIQYNGIPWISLANSNTGHTPVFADVDPTTGIVPAQSTWWRSYYSTLPDTPIAQLNQVSHWAPMLMGSPHQGTSEPRAQGTRIVPQFKNSVALVMGTNGFGTVKDISIYFKFELPPGGAHFGGPSLFGANCPYSIGVAVAGGGSGASGTIIENVCVNNAYIGFLFGHPGTGGLADNNVMRRCAAPFCYAFYYSASTQTYINQLYDCTPSSTIGCVSPRGVISIFGGNWSALEEGSPSAAFAITSTSAFSIGSGNGYYYFGGTLIPGASYINISTTVTAPDNLLISSAQPDRAGVYNVYTILTPSYGPIPFVTFPGSFNSSTNVLTLMMSPPWVDTFLGNTSGGYLSALQTQTNIEAEIRAATTLYAACMVFPFQCSVNAFGVFFENANTSMCLSSNQAFGPSLISGLYYDASASMFNSAPPFSPSPALLAHYYAQKTTPYIYLENDVILDSNAWGDTGGPYRDPIIIYAANGKNSRIINRDSSAQSQPNTVPTMSFWSGANGGGPFYGPGGPYYASANVLAYWQGNCTGNIPTWNNGFANSLAKDWTDFGQGATYQGIRPSQWTIPAYPATQFTTLANPQVLPQITSDLYDGSRATTSYPLIYGGTPYQTTYICPSHLVANGGKTGNIIFESNHDFYSYHQDLTATNISSMSWHARGQSWCVFMDPNGITFMFPGLVIGLTSDTLHYYLVTGVYAAMGYITVYRLDVGQSTFVSYVSGVKGTVYTGTTISSQPYRIRVLSAPPLYSNSAVTAIAGQEIMADTSGAAWSLKLPINPVQTDKVVWYDVGGSFPTHNLLVDGNGARINSSADNVNFTTTGTGTALYVNTTIGWVVSGGTLVASPSLLVTPFSTNGGNIDFSGQWGNTFTPSPYTFTLVASSSTVPWTLTGVPSYLTASAASGTATTTPGTVTLTPNPGSLNPGVYGPDTITFTNTASGQTTTRSVKLYIIAKEYAAEGDSITTTASTHGAGYPADYDFTAAPIVRTNNFATGGAFLDTLIGRAPLLDQIVSRKKSGDKYVLSVMVGTNDVSFGYRIGTGTQAEWIAAYTAYLDARRASGWFVIICTNISRGNPTSSPYGGTVDSQIIPLNVTLRSWVGTHADALCDFAANANFAPGGTVYNNLTYYQADQTHPTVAGEDLMATIITPIINAHM